MKHFKISDENQELVDKLFAEMGFDNYMQIKVIGTTKAKEVIKVSKNNPVTQYIGNLPDDTVMMFIYEEVFDRLDENCKKLLIRDSLSTIVYDDEKDKINIGVPTIVVTQFGREKYGEELLNAAESALLAMKQIEEEKAKIKEEARAAKKNK